MARLNVYFSHSTKFDYKNTLYIKVPYGKYYCRYKND